MPLTANTAPSSHARACPSTDCLLHILSPEPRSAHLQVLPEREDVDARVARIEHRIHDLVVRLAEPEHDRRLRVHATRLGGLQHGQRLHVVGACVAHAALQPLDRLDVVCEDVKAAARQVAHSCQVAAARGRVQGIGLSK